MSRLWNLLSSSTTTLWILGGLAVLLLLNVVLPQEALEGPDRIRALVAGNAAWRFVLADLGMARLPTSIPFLALLGLFFLNLLAVLVRRTGPVVGGLGRRPPAAGDLDRRLARPDGREAPLPENWEPRRVPRTLKGHGYRPVMVGPERLWAVKHRSAPLGSLLFHSSFLLLALGGAMLYYTRFDGRVRLAEGQAFDGRYQRVARLPLLGGAPPLAFEVRSVEALTKGGEPLDLQVDLLVGEGRGAEARTARINHPAAWGGTRLLVSEAGLAPVLWLQNGQGYTVDRVSVLLSARSGNPVEVPLADGRWTAVLAFENPGADIPGRERLPVLDFAVTVREGERLRYQGPLRPGRPVAMEGGYLLIPEVRYWASVQVVTERGGGLLVLGFVLAVVGLTWRLLLHRRELVLAWDGGRLRLNGRGEYYGRAFEEEKLAVFDRLLAPEPGPVPDSHGGVV